MAPAQGLRAFHGVYRRGGADFAQSEPFRITVAVAHANRPSFEGDVSQHTLGKWVSTGRTDLKAGKRQTAFARFAQRYQDLIDEHCGPDTNRNREFDRALEILERTCECGNDKMLLPDGKLASTCQECQDLDARQPRRARRV